MSRTWSKQLVVTVSVEPDDPWVVGRTGLYRSLDGLGRFHELCRRYAVRPTYLLTYSAAGERRCVELARSCGDEAEFGAHLHPEEVPPVGPGEGEKTTLRPGEVEPERLRAKLANLAQRVAEATGRRPTSYRAGFFDLTPFQVSVLMELGFEADSSLGPLEKTREGYPFLGTPFAPYRLDAAAPGGPAGGRAGPMTNAECRMTNQCRMPNDESMPEDRFQMRDTAKRVSDDECPAGGAGCRPTEAGAGPQSAIGNRQSAILVEVPMTSVFRRPFPRALFRAYFALPARVRGALRAVGVAEVLRFRPATSSAEELLAVCRRTERMGIPAVMSVHSNELVAGTSTTVRTEAESAAYFERLERVFAHAREQGWTSETLTDIAGEFRQAARLNRQPAIGNRQSES